MTNTINQVLDKESWALLSGLRGQRWRCFGGAQVTDWLTDVAIFVATEESAVTISGEVDDLDFEGHLDSYSRFRVDAGAPDFDAATRSGGVFLHFAGQEIREVLVVRESVTRREDGHPRWIYVNDIAVVFVLDAGAVALAKVSHHSELLKAMWADGVALLDVKQPTTVWTDRIGVEHEITREIVPL